MRVMGTPEVFFLCEHVRAARAKLAEAKLGVVVLQWSAGLMPSYGPSRDTVVDGSMDWLF